MRYEVLKALNELTTDQLADIALRLGAKHPTEFEKLILGDSDKVTFEVPFSTIKATFTKAQLEVLRQLGDSGPHNKIECIKRIREFSGIGLKEAKDLCEKEFI